MSRNQKRIEAMAITVYGRAHHPQGEDDEWIDEFYKLNKQDQDYFRRKAICYILDAKRILKMLGP